LTKYFANSRFSSKEDAIKNIKENCGWDVKVSGDLKEVPVPTLEELRLLRVFDPKKHYIE